MDFWVTLCWIGKLIGLAIAAGAFALGLWEAMMSAMEE